ncbi:MAG: glycosyltransferase family 2 protein, partial [Phycisphaerae bacterium]
MTQTPDIAVVIPCRDEEATVATVVRAFREQLPEARIYVFDNCSTDRTAEIARKEGATVIREPRQGKGFVIESMLERVEAEYYVMVDGDDTYDAQAVHKLLEPVVND